MRNSTTRQQLVNATVDHRRVGRFVAMLVIAAGLPLGSGCAGSRHDEVDRRAMDHHFRSPDHLAKEWNDPERDSWQRPDEIMRALGSVTDGVVADLGAGTGYLIEPLRDTVGDNGRVIALDVEPAMVAFLDARRVDEGWTNVEIRKSAPDDPGLEPNSVDAIVTLNTWHHLENRAEFARKLLNAVRVGGRLVVVDFLQEPTEGFGPPLAMRLSAEQVIADLQAGGFLARVIDENLPRHYIVVATKG